MKYLIKYKTYENKKITSGNYGNYYIIGNIIGNYYIIHIDGSFEKFEIALEKLGIHDDFFKDWNIINYNDLIDKNKEYFSKNVIFLCIYKTIYNKTHYLIGNNVKELKNFGLDFVSLKFKGEIFIEDYELDAKKFNI